MADFGATELDAFRTEVREWLAANYPAELKGDSVPSDPEAVWGGRAFAEVGPPRPGHRHTAAAA